MNLESFLLNPNSELPSLAFLQYHRLEGWFYAQLPEGHAIRQSLRPTILARAARHALTKNHVLNLARVWNQVGLEPMLYKGFAVAELVYKNPFERFYGDVDVFLPREVATQASKTARGAGWIEVKSLEDSPELYRHEYSNFLSADQICRIDFHIDLIQGHHFDSRRDQFARTIYEASHRTQLEDTFIRLPTPVDLLILMLVSRRWGLRWANKPADYPDAQIMVQKYALSYQAVRERARELRCLRTFDLALQTCDPWQTKVRLTPPRLVERWYKDFLCQADFGLREWERFSRIKPHGKGFFRILLPLVKAYWYRARGGDLNIMLEQFDAKPEPDAITNYAALESVQYGMNWAMRLSPIKFNPCVPRSLALLQVLSELGFAASFVSGVRRKGHKLDGHAWIEVDGIPLEIIGDSNSPNIFKENFRFDNWLLRQRKANLEAQK
ncbi:MAG: hypothetical protein RLZZ156_2143 [Deinococcota bacterium]|jgi:hypothetical protein